MARKTSWSTLAGFKEVREVVTMFPPALKTLSEGTLVLNRVMLFQMAVQIAGIGMFCFYAYMTDSAYRQIWVFDHTRLCF